jgi:hypothetical protein
MTTKILTAGPYSLSAAIKKVQAVPDTFHVKFTSQQDGTRFPEEHRTVFTFTGGGESLRTLRGVIDGALNETGGV